MKFLHIADLHIGKTVNGFSMAEPQAEVLGQIAALARGRAPGAVVIAGDIYDKPMPGADAVRIFDRFLTELSETGAAVLAIPGNHDAPERIGFAGKIMEKHNVFMCGPFDGRPQAVRLEDEFGGINFFMLPFINPRAARRFFGEAAAESYDSALRAAVGAADVDFSSRNVLIAHQFVISAGCEPERSDSEAGPVGGLDSVDASVFSGFDYVALGHLHGAQHVGLPHIRYAGSPLKYSFSEWRHSKAALSVEIREKGHISIQSLPLTPLHDMRKIRGPLSELLSGEIAGQGDRQDYMHVTLTDDDEIIDAIGKVRSVYPNVMALAFDNRRTQEAPAAWEPGSIEGLSPFGLFEAFFAAQNGAPMNGRQAAIAKELLEGGIGGLP
ncbi:MAG: exonuclease SbcCD subunit D [Clostridiales Family XIII bacterium]|jgi:exonuclease SbcD|nr:exonuclease SbcCD subunit D [Clostridiales Family XIII bacterium]